jgi:hypothetical protein
LEISLRRYMNLVSIDVRQIIQYFNRLVVYADVVITRHDSRGIARLKQFLQQRFHTKDLGQLRYFLSIEVAKSQTYINLCQKKYVLG